MYLLSFIIFLSYLVGSIPTGILITKWVKNADIRRYGSGNTGSTNVSRILGWKWGLVVQILDVLKGLFAVMVIARLHYGDIPFNNRTPFEDFTLIQFIAGLSAIVGHIWSIFAQFKGGKGINTAAGMLIGVAPIDLLIALSVFAIVLFVSGYVSLGSISAAAAVPTTLIVRFNVFHVDIPSYHTLLICSMLMSLLLIYTHRANIRRLITGTENRFNKLRIFGKTITSSMKSFIFF